MEESEVYEAPVQGWTVVNEEVISSSPQEGPLMVAMQPGSVQDPSAMEVVVISTGNPGDFVVQLPPGSDIAPEQIVAAVEEVRGEDTEEPTEEFPGESQLDPDADQDDSDLSFSTSSDSEEEPPPPKRTKTAGKRGRPPVKKPKARDFARRLQWSDADMKMAMKAVTEKNVSIRGAAKKYKVPYSSLKDRVHGRVQHGVKPGVKTALTPEEEERLATYIKDMQAAGFELRGPDVRDRAAEILRGSTCPSSPNKDWSPGHNWFAGFRKRHPDITMKRAFNRLGSPSITKQRQVVKQFYESMAYAFKKAKVMGKPDRIFSVNETTISVFQRATVIVCSSASGNVMHPFAVIAGQRLKLTSAQNAYPEAFFASSATGEVTEEIFFQWFRDHFVKGIAKGKHCVLIMSYPPNYITVKLYRLAKDHKVTLVNIHETVNDVLQPLNDMVCNRLDMVLIKKASKWQNENQGTPFTQKVLAQLLRKAWKKGISAEEITANFATSGIYPLNTTATTTEKLVRKASERKSPAQNDSNNLNLSGLSLLSALSSHEYASMEHLSWNSRTSGGVLPSASFPPIDSDNDDTMLELKARISAQEMHSADRDSDNEENESFEMETVSTKQKNKEDNSRKLNSEAIFQESNNLVIDSAGNVIQTNLAETEENMNIQVMQSEENVIETEIVDHQECVVIKNADFDRDSNQDQSSADDIIQTEIVTEENFIVVKKCEDSEEEDSLENIEETIKTEEEADEANVAFTPPVKLKDPDGSSENKPGTIIVDQQDLMSAEVIQCIDGETSLTKRESVEDEPMEIRIVSTVSVKNEDTSSSEFTDLKPEDDSDNTTYVNEENGKIMIFENTGQEIIMVPISEQTITIE